MCVDPQNIKEDIKKYSPALVQAAKNRAAQGNEDQYPFVWLDVAEFEAHAKEELGCSTFPTIVLQVGVSACSDVNLTTSKYHKISHTQLYAILAQLRRRDARAPSPCS